MNKEDFKGIRRVLQEVVARYEAGNLPVGGSRNKEKREIKIKKATRENVAECIKKFEKHAPLIRILNEENISFCLITKYYEVFPDEIIFVKRDGKIKLIFSTETDTGDHHKSHYEKREREIGEVSKLRAKDFEFLDDEALKGFYHDITTGKMEEEIDEMLRVIFSR